MILCYIYVETLIRVLLLMEEILHQLIGSFSHYLQDFLHFTSQVVQDFFHQQYAPFNKPIILAQKYPFVKLVKHFQEKYIDIFLLEKVGIFNSMSIFVLCPNFFSLVITVTDSPRVSTQHRLDWRYHGRHLIYGGAIFFCRVSTEQNETKQPFESMYLLLKELGDVPAS